MERMPMTRTGYDKLKTELKHLENEQMPEIEKRIATARSEGDLSENAEYHGARETQGMLQAKINLLRDKLSRADLVDPSTLPRDQVVFGVTVKVKDLDFGDIEEFTLVGAGEEDYDAGKILVTSPIGQGLFLPRDVGGGIPM
jgi:transcription elongation factor GreA